MTFLLTECSMNINYLLIDLISSDLHVVFSLWSFSDHSKLQWCWMKRHTIYTQCYDHYISLTVTWWKCDCLTICLLLQLTTGTLQLSPPAIFPLILPFWVPWGCFPPSWVPTGFGPTFCTIGSRRLGPWLPFQKIAQTMVSRDHVWTGEVLPSWKWVPFVESLRRVQFSTLAPTSRMVQGRLHITSAGRCFRKVICKEVSGGKHAGAVRPKSVGPKGVGSGPEACEDPARWEADLGSVGI